MRTTVEELEAKLGKELIVFIDGKRIAFPIEFDTEEGWCIAHEYHLSQGKNYSKEEALAEAKNEDDSLIPLDYTETRLEGKITIAVWKEPHDPTAPRDSPS